MDLFNKDLPEKFSWDDLHLWKEEFRKQARFESIDGPFTQKVIGKVICVFSQRPAALENLTKETGAQTLQKSMIIHARRLSISTRLQQLAPQIIEAKKEMGDLTLGQRATTDLMIKHTCSYYFTGKHEALVNEMQGLCAVLYVRLAEAGWTMKDF